MPPFDGPIPPQLAALQGAPPGMPPGAGAGPNPPAGAPLPPSLMAGPPGAGGPQVPQGNPGNSLAAVAAVRNAVMLLQKALPSLPMGTELHTVVLKTVGDLTKNLPDIGGEGQGQISQLMQVIQQLAHQQPNRALAAAAQPASAPPVLPPPSMPPPGGPPPGMDMAA